MHLPDHAPAADPLLQRRNDRRRLLRAFNASLAVVLVLGANDVVNPVAKTDPASPIYGMPILDVANSKNTIVIKRGKGTGFAGIENALFYQDNTRMLYGDGAAAVAQLVSELKAVDGGH